MPTIQIPKPLSYLKVMKIHTSKENGLSLALFFLDGEYICGGALIAVYHVLTVVKCYHKFMNRLSDVEVHLGVMFGMGHQFCVRNVTILNLRDETDVNNNQIAVIHVRTFT